MKKENIYVEITNEPERLRAIEILQNAGEEILEGSMLTDLFECVFNIAFKKSDNQWMKLNIIDNETKITLDELETLLNPKKSNVFTEVQEWIRENDPNITYRFQNDEPECISKLREHLKNDYPQGTEIKISKDKIEIYHS